MARVQDLKTVGIKELTARITGRGMSLTDTEVQAVLNELSYAINEELQAGNAVSTPFVRIQPSIGGIFANKDDVFDASRHSIRLNATPGGRIEVDTAKLPTKKVKAEVLLAEMDSVTDFVSQRTNDVMTRNGTVEIKGHNLKIDQSDPEQGVFIKNQGQETRVELYMLNKPSHIIFLVPNGAPGGEVELEIRNANRSKTVRASVFAHKLIIP